MSLTRLRSLLFFFSILFFFSAVIVMAVGGCSKSDTEMRQDDRAKMELIIAEDVRASKAMAEADEAARHGNVPGALDAVTHRAQPAIEAGLRACGATQLKTEWGRMKMSELSKILTDRQSELSPYSEAVKSNDPQKLIDSMEAQAKIERRAIATVSEVRGTAPPP